MTEIDNELLCPNCYVGSGYFVDQTGTWRIDYNRQKFLPRRPHEPLPPVPEDVTNSIDSTDDTTPVATSSTTQVAQCTWCDDEPAMTPFKIQRICHKCYKKAGLYQCTWCDDEPAIIPFKTQRICQTCYMHAGLHKNAEGNWSVDGHSLDVAPEPPLLWRNNKGDWKLTDGFVSDDTRY